MHIRFCTTGAKQFLNRVLYLFMIHRYTDYSLLPHNTFGMDVKAAFFVEYTSVDDLQTVLAERRRAGAEGRLLPIGVEATCCLEAISEERSSILPYVV